MATSAKHVGPRSELRCGRDVAPIVAEQTMSECPSIKRKVLEEWKRHVRTVQTRFVVADTELDRYYKATNVREEAGDEYEMTRITTLQRIEDLCCKLPRESRCFWFDPTSGATIGSVTLRLCRR